MVENQSPTGDAEEVSPPPVTCVASWNACTSGMLDGALVGTAIGLVVGIAVGSPLGWVLLPVGLATGTVSAAAVLRRRLWVALDDRGLRSSTVRHLDELTWDEVAAVGLVPGRIGRSGRSWSVGVCRAGELDVLRLPALTVRTSIVQRLGDEVQEERTEHRRDRLLDPLLPFAAACDIRVVDGDLVAWWDASRR